MDLELSGKVALVTGGSRGIGRATALTLARSGSGVAICARGTDTLEATLAELSAVSADVWGVTADVTNASDVERFVSGAASALGRIDIVVCNVGGSFGGPFLEASDEDWMNTLGHQSVAQCEDDSRGAAPHERERGRERRHRFLDLRVETGAGCAIRRSKSRRGTLGVVVGVGAGAARDPRQHRMSRLNHVRWRRLAKVSAEQP